MKILFVCHRLPFPPNRGGKIRPFNMIRHLSRKHSVVVASLAHTEQELKEGAGLKDYCDEVIAEVVPPSARWLQAIRAVPTRTPSSVAYFWSARLYERIKQIALHAEFDVTLVHCAFVAQYVMQLQTGFRIMDFGDLDSAKWAEYSHWKSFPFSRMYAFESAKLQAYERKVARMFDRCTVTTGGEQDEFQNLSAPASCTVIPNGVDVSYFSPPKVSTRPDSSIVFLGRMDYFPNIDGVCYFTEQILPLIRNKMPHVEFRIVGSNPTRRIRELAKVPGTVVTGHVPDVRRYLQDGAIAIAPLRIARGTQNKILESMAMGIPVVATPNAAKGIQAVPGRDLLVAATPQAFANHVLALLHNADLRRSLSDAARKQVEQAHLWPGAMKILDHTLAEQCT
jgi:sugar transferase (PEP-CTERM/EpsH1 system associated)